MILATNIQCPLGHAADVSLTWNARVSVDFCDGRPVAVVLHGLDQNRPVELRCGVCSSRMVLGDDVPGLERLADEAAAAVRPRYGSDLCLEDANA